MALQAFVCMACRASLACICVASLQAGGRLPLSLLLTLCPLLLQTFHPGTSSRPFLMTAGSSIVR